MDETFILTLNKLKSTEDIIDQRQKRISVMDRHNQKIMRKNEEE